MSSSFLPYVEIPLNLTTCNGASAPLLNFCDFMAQLAGEATQPSDNPLSCMAQRRPHCNEIHCMVLPSNDTMDFIVEPCNDPPAIRLISSSIQGPVKFNRTYNSSMSFEASIGGGPVTLHLTIVQHPQELTLGVGVRLG